jgi:hypothetical protein
MAIDETLSKGASLVEAPHEKGTPLNRGNIAPAKALIEQVALKGRNDPLEGRTTPWIIAKFKVNLPLAVRCQNLQPDIPEHAGDVMGALAIGQGAVIVTPQVQEASDIAADVSQPLGGVKGLGEAFGFMQVHEVLLRSLEWHEYTA